MHPAMDQASEAVASAGQGSRPAIMPDDVRSELDELCRRFHVQTLDVFGSANTGHFDPSRSDIDMLVEFPPLPGSGRADAYLSLHAALQSLFQRRVDLLTVPSVRNPYLRRSIEQTRRQLFPKP